MAEGRSVGKVVRHSEERTEGREGGKEGGRSKGRERKTRVVGLAGNRKGHVGCA